MVGDIQIEDTSGTSSDATASTATEMRLGNSGFGLGHGEIRNRAIKQSNEQRIIKSGVTKSRVHFGSVHASFRKLADELGDKRGWILLDEWSSIPVDLQPYLADLFRRTVLPNQNFTVKIAAIEQRSSFRILTEHGDYIGIELGADVAADLNLDDYMAFDNDAEQAKRFFQELLFRHYKEIDDADAGAGPQTSDELIQTAFTQITAFDEYVRAAEGVPRDAINIINLASQRSFGRKISTGDIRNAAYNWYERDKQTAIKSNKKVLAFLHWTVDKVIAHRRSRAFMIRSDQEYDLINQLYDARIIHVLIRNRSALTEPGIRYDAFKLDYGCYVDLINTSKAPLGLFHDDVGTYEVPPDDYRAIRRAILDISQFENFYSHQNS